MSDVDEHNDGVVPDGGNSAPPTGDVVPVDPADDLGDDQPSGPTPGRRPFDWKLWIASLPIAVGVLLIAYGVNTAITGDDVAKLPNQIESISPVPDAVQVLAQTNIVVDLEEGYEGRLTIDDVEFETQRLEDFNQSNNADPGTQIDIPAGVLFEGGNNTLTFTPGPDIAITKFTEGNHTVRVVYWRTLVGEQEARSYTWTFNVI
jgi:hypothetical protein